jgi:hypothetical protein
MTATGLVGQVATFVQLHVRVRSELRPQSIFSPSERALTGQTGVSLRPADSVLPHSS